MQTVVALISLIPGLGRVYQNYLMDAKLIGKPAPTNLLMRMLQDVNLHRPT